MYRTSKFTAKEAAFVIEYLVDLNAIAAAKRAGYAASTAIAKASTWVIESRDSCPPNKQHVWDAVNEAKAKRAEHTGINAEYVLQQAKKLHERCMQEEPVLDRYGNITGVYKFDAAGAAKGLELLGKHVGVQAFREQVVVEHKPADAFQQAVQDALNESKPQITH